jgi:hypothetical protein
MFLGVHLILVECKRKMKGPRAQNFKRAETSLGSSLGPPKNGSAYQKPVTHAFCFSHYENMPGVCTNKISRENVGRRSRYQYINGQWSCIKKLHSTGILATLKSKPMHSKAKRKGTVFNLSSLINADICDGEDYCYFVINNHSPRAKCYQSTFTIISMHAVSLQRIIVVV